MNYTHILLEKHKIFATINRTSGFINFPYFHIKIENRFFISQQKVYNLSKQIPFAICCIYNVYRCVDITAFITKKVNSHTIQKK